MRSEQEIFQDLASLCTSPGYAHALAVICLREETLPFENTLTVKDLSRQSSKSRLTRTEVTTLIGLMMRSPINLTAPAPHVIGDYLDQTNALLEELHQAVSVPLHDAISAASAVTAESSPFGSAAVLREPIFYGPESAYDFQYRDLAPRKYVNDAAWLRQHKGVDLVIARLVCIGIAKLTGERLTEALHEFAAKPSPDWTPLPVLRVSCDDLAERINRPTRSVRAILDAFALPDGRCNDSFTSLQAYNEAYAHPVIRAGGDDFIVFQPYVMSQAIYETPIYWMWKDKAYASTASRHRGEFAEDFAADRLAHVFGAERVFRNVEMVRRNGQTLSEIDVLAVFGNRAIIVQAKSKKMTLLARSGNDRKLRSDFKAAVQDSVDQALRCAELLDDPSVSLRAKDGVPVRLPETLETVFPLSVVAEHYPALAFQVRQFLQVRTNAHIRHPLVIDVFALDAMTEMLESPLRLLNYLSLRDRFDTQLTMSHEFMLLSYHLRGNLWVRDDVDMLALPDDVSADLDVAMTVRRSGVPGERTPEGILTRMAGTHFAKIVSEIENEPEPVVIDLGLMLLELSEESVRTINENINVILSRTATDGVLHDMTIGFAEASCGLTIHCSRLGFKAAERQLWEHCTMRKYSQKADRWFGLGLRPNGSIQVVAKLTGPWRFDETMEAVLENQPLRE